MILAGKPEKCLHQFSSLNHTLYLPQFPDVQLVSQSIVENDGKYFRKLTLTVDSVDQESEHETSDEEADTESVSDMENSKPVESNPFATNQDMLPQSKRKEADMVPSVEKSLVTRPSFTQVAKNRALKYFRVDFPQSLGYTRTNVIADAGLSMSRSVGVGWTCDGRMVLSDGFDDVKLR